MAAAHRAAENRDSEVSQHGEAEQGGGHEIEPIAAREASGGGQGIGRDLGPVEVDRFAHALDLARHREVGRIELARAKKRPERLALRAPRRGGLRPVPVERRPFRPGFGQLEVGGEGLRIVPGTSRLVALAKKHLGLGTRDRGPGGHAEGRESKAQRPARAMVIPARRHQVVPLMPIS